MSTRKIESVLYVDDDPDICEVVKATLSLIAGLNVQTACSGEQAIDLAYVQRPDLVLMDVMMPGLDGPCTLKRMRGHALLVDIPVIFLTAKVLPAEVAHLLKLGALGVIGKPFDPLKLCDDVFSLWNHSAVLDGINDVHSGETEVEAQVSTLAGSFLGRTQGDVLRLRAMIERARHVDGSALEDAQRMAHSIHGAGAMFGFPEVSVAGGEIERLAGAAMAGTAAPRSPCEPALLQQLLDCVDRLALAVEASEQTTLRGAGMFTSRSAADGRDSSSRHEPRIRATS
jgi:two-component system, OmpR family, response regulator